MNKHGRIIAMDGSEIRDRQRSLTRVLDAIDQSDREDPNWPADDPDTFAATCQRCGRDRLLQMVVDPFVAEGIDENEDPGTLHGWCKPCYELRWDDV